MRVTLAQIAPKLSFRANLDTHLGIIERQSAHSDLIIFPELSLHGYLLQDKLYEDAVSVDEIQSIQALSKDVDIIVGLALKDERAVYNSALYFSKGRLLHRHDKNYLANYGMFEEARYFFKGEGVSAFQTEFGSVMMVVCEDLWRASMIEQIAHNRPRHLFVIANSPARDFHDEGLAIEDQWQAILQSTAIMTGANVVFVNRVGFEDGLGFWGGSSIINSHGKKIKSLARFKEDIADFNLAQTLFEANRLIMKHN